MIRWDDGDRVVLYSPRTGRHAVVSPQTADAPDAAPAPVRQRLAELGLLGPVDVATLVPCRSRLVLLLPDGLWAPVPGARTAGGHGYRTVALSEPERRAWLAINDARTTALVAGAAGIAVADLTALLARLTAPDVQAVQLRPRPAHPRDPGLSRLVAPPRPPSPRPADQRGAHGETTLLDYHLAIEDGATHFDDHETTVAHALALPHPGLEGVPYGTRLRRALGDRVRGAVVEVGCGTGELARDFLADGPLPWLRVDLSPELLRTQAATAPGTRGVLADGTRLPLRDGSVDLLVSNEVIADLAAVPWDPDAPRTGPVAAVAERIARYGLEVGPGLVNLGAWQLVEEAARVLAPGGTAVITEFGDVDGAPEEAVQLDHPEVSIQFGHLRAVARALGLRAEVVPLADLLGARLDALQLARFSYEALRARARAEGWHLAARAWTPETLRLPWPVEGLAWVPLSEPGPGPLITRFQALIATRP